VQISICGENEARRNRPFYCIEQIARRDCFGKLNGYAFLRVIISAVDVKTAPRARAVGSFRATLATPPGSARTTAESQFTPRRELVRRVPLLSLRLRQTVRPNLCSRGGMRVSA
jgi:hypothetical protein